MESLIIKALDFGGVGVAILALGILLYYLIDNKKSYSTKMDSIQSDVTLVKTNHLSHIQGDLSRLLDGQGELIKYQEKQLYILEEIKNALRK